jgi:hypothetical protein
VSIALITHVGAASTDGNNVTTVDKDTTGANFIIVALALFSFGTPGPTDSFGNIYVPLNVYSDQLGVYRLRLWYCNSPRVGPGHNWTVTTTSETPSICVEAFSISPGQFFLDAQSGRNSNSPGPFMVFQAGELFITAVVSSGGAPSAVDSGFHITDTITPSVNIALGLGMAWVINAGTAELDPTWTAAGLQATTQAAFKFTGSTPPTPPSPPPETCQPAPVPSYTPGLVADQEPPELTGS